MGTATQVGPARYLPWSKIFRYRCRAVIEPNDTGYWGRCELARGHAPIDHALERGLVIVRWETEPRLEQS